jgi:polysaccharide biosynthesis/export protein
VASGQGIFHMKGAVMALAVLALCACATSSTPFVWANDYQDPAGPTQPGYTIQPGDVLGIRVFNQPDMSTRARVRDDGKISVPFLNDVMVAGLAPDALASQLQSKLREFINAPVVTVSLEEGHAFQVAVIGEVAKPGVYPVPVGAGVLPALAAAGGFNLYASRDRIFVVRNAPQRVRIRFTYEQLTDSQAKASGFRLRPGDSIVVE